MAATLSFDATDYQAGVRHPPHQHDCLHLSLVLKGAVAEAVNGVTEYAGVLSIVAKDAGVVHADQFGPTGAKLARLTLPSGTIGELIDDPRRAPSWQWKHQPDIAKSFLRLVRRASAGVTVFGTDDPDLLDILALLTVRPASSPRGRPPGWLEQTMGDLRQSWYPGLTVRTWPDVPVFIQSIWRAAFGAGTGRGSEKSCGACDFAGPLLRSPDPGRQYRMSPMRPGFRTKRISAAASNSRWTSARGAIARCFAARCSRSQRTPAWSGEATRLRGFKFSRATGCILNEP